MTDQVSSRFSIASKTLDSDLLKHSFAWPIVEIADPEKVEAFITVYDLEVGKHSQVDHHLEAVKLALLKNEMKLGKLRDDCQYTLWVRYRFPSREGAFNLSPYLLSFFSFLRIEVIFHLNEN